MTHARSCCCTAGNPCDNPGQGFCISVELSGVGVPGCLTQAFGYDNGDGSNTGRRSTRIETLIVDGPMTVEYDGAGWPVRARGKGLAIYSYAPDPDRYPWGVDTEIVVDFGIICSGDQLLLIRLEATIQGGGSPLPILTGTTGGTPNGNLFWGVQRGAQFARRLDQGPVVLQNLNTPEQCSSDLQPLSSSGTITVTLLDGQQCPQEEADQLILVACDGSGDEIIVDPDLATGEPTALYQGRLWKPDRRGSGDPVTVEWVDQECPDTQANKLATKCRGIGEIGLDPASIPTSARTCTYKGERYQVTRIDTTLDAVSVVYSNKTCSGIPLPDCSDIVDHTDPRCSDPVWRACPKCGSAGGRPIGDPVRPGFDLSSPDDDGGGGDLAGLGDVVKHAIEFLRLDKLANPDRCGCERRRLILNRYGGAYGRAIAKRLGL